MSRLERLLKNYRVHASLPWEKNLAPPQRVWFAVYDPPDERRLRLRIQEFELATHDAGHGWALVDLTGAFPQWMAANEYRDAYFEAPTDLSLSLPRFLEEAASKVRQQIEAPGASESTVVAVLGVATLFGFGKVSDLVHAVAPHIRGRLLIFFPGQYEGATYRLLDARDGWNYMAVPITADERELS